MIFKIFLYYIYDLFVWEAFVHKKNLISNKSLNCIYENIILNITMCSRSEKILTTEKFIQIMTH